MGDEPGQQGAGTVPTESTTLSPSLPESYEESDLTSIRDSPKQTPIQRTRTGCHTCRNRRVKCDEQKPTCSQCCKGKRLCLWPAPEDKQQKPRLPRRPNATACALCKQKKIKCVGGLASACERCCSLGIDCLRALPIAVQKSSELEPLPAAASSASVSVDANEAAPLLGQLPKGKELEDLVRLYFTTVHNFGYFSFVHQLRFGRLVAKGKAPRELTLIMIASAMRFAAESTPENLAQADAWADAAIEAVLPRIYHGFGALQLMVLLLAQHYDRHRGRFSSAWLLSANCTRMVQMMSLQTFDRTYADGLAPQLQLSPLLTCEALRRLAWSNFYSDTIVDGGRYGFHLVDEHSHRLQLPCDQMSFLSDEAVVTEPLFVETKNMTAESSGSGTDSRDQKTPGAPGAISLDMAAFLLRTAAVRRRAMHFAFRASHREEPAEKLMVEMAQLEADVEQVIVALPKRFAFNLDNMAVHRDRLNMFLLLHVLRQNLYIVLSRAALLIYERCQDGDQLTPLVRRNRIARALPVAGLVAEGLKAGICFDPQFGVCAYVALESRFANILRTCVRPRIAHTVVLLFEPRRLAKIDPAVDPLEPRLMEALPHLLRVVREIGLRSELVRLLHVEAVHRLLRCECSRLLTQADFEAFTSEYTLVGQDTAEYDFRDFRWVKVERLQRGGHSAAGSHMNMACNEVLLEDKVDGMDRASTPASPRLDALDVTRDLGAGAASSSVISSDMHPVGHVGNASPQQQTPALSLAAHSIANYDFSLDWSWSLDETSSLGYQTGDPTLFWNQVYQT